MTALDPSGLSLRLTTVFGASLSLLLLMGQLVTAQTLGVDKSVKPASNPRVLSVDGQRILVGGRGLKTRTLNVDEPQRNQGEQIRDRAQGQLATIAKLRQDIQRLEDAGRKEESDPLRRDLEVKRLQFQVENLNNFVEESSQQQQRLLERIESLEAEIKQRRENTAK